MTEKFDSAFHKKYVGGDGGVEERQPQEFPKNKVERISYDQVLAEYRAYVGDPEAELPGELLLFCMFS